MYEVSRTDGEIDAQLNAAQQHVEEGKVAWPGMSYEQGVIAGIQWVLGDVSDEPMAE